MFQRSIIFGFVVAFLLGLPGSTWASSRASVAIHTNPGDFTIQVGWTVDPDDGMPVLEGTVSFLPDGKTFPACASLKMIQAAHLTTNDLSNYIWSGAQANRNLIETRADPTHGVLGGFYIDHDASKCRAGSACSPYFRDSWPNPEGSQNGFVRPDHSVAAVSLRDYPVGWTDFARISLESCVACSDNGQLYQCVTWGGYWPEISTGYGDPRVVTIGSKANPPSPTFMKALSLFHLFY